MSAQVTTQVKEMNAVILDETSFNPGDLDLTPLIRLNKNWQRFDSLWKRFAPPILISHLHKSIPSQNYHSYACYVTLY